MRYGRGVATIDDAARLALGLPEGPILAVRVEDLIEKEAVLQADPEGFFTIPHLDGYPAVLVDLRAVKKEDLKDAIDDGWLACAPRDLAERHAPSL